MKHEIGIPVVIAKRERDWGYRDNRNHSVNRGLSRFIQPRMGGGAPQHVIGIPLVIAKRETSD